MKAYQVEMKFVMVVWEGDMEQYTVEALVDELKRLVKLQRECVDVASYRLVKQTTEGEEQ